MMRIKSFSILQTSKAVAVLYLLLIAVIGIPVGLGVVLARNAGFGFALILLLPIGYALLGFVITAIACALYNVVARWTGGIEIDLGPAPHTTSLQLPQ
jgi:hypothetical protein